MDMQKRGEDAKNRNKTFPGIAKAMDYSRLNSFFKISTINTAVFLSNCMD